MRQQYCTEHGRLLEFVGMSSGMRGCFLCASFGDLKGEKVDKIYMEEEEADPSNCTRRKATINKMFCEPPFQVNVLSISSPTHLSVRPVSFDEAAYEMELELSNFYNELPNGEFGTLANISDGTACVVKWDSKWRRAVVVSRMEEETELVDIVTIRLIDLGLIVTTDVVNLRSLSPLFLSYPALCIICHLSGLQHWVGKEWPEADLTKMKSMIPENYPVFLLRRGPPEQNLNGGYYSMPVDLYWEEVTRPDPFMPELVTEFSFTKMLALEFGVTCSLADLDDTIEDNEDEENVDDMNDEVGRKEFSDVKPLPNIDGFRWLDPELPSESQFSARGTFVDESGQIYVQLHSRRHTVRVLRRLMNEKFSSSEPSLDEELKPSQECCVKWRDGSWYRARFIQYLDTSMERKKCLVTLVDYGNMYQVLMDDVRTEIYAERIPIQCLRLVLAGIEPVGGSWSQQCLDLVQEKINYAKLEGNDKLSVAVVGKSSSLPLLVSIYEKSTKGVMVDLSQILCMIFPQYVAKVNKLNPMPDPLSSMNKSLAWGCVPPGHYKEHNPFFLLCPEYSSDNTEYVATIPIIDWNKAEIWEGQKLQVELPDDNIYIYNVVHVVPVTPFNSYFSSLSTKHQHMYTSMQSVCERNPPVLQPRPRLPVAAKWGEDGWFRAVIVRVMEKAILVEFVDYGTRAWVSDSMQVKELPEEWLNLPAIAIQVHLDIQAVESDDDDVVASVIKECLLTWEKDMWLKVKNVEDGDKIRGHLVDRNDKNVYKQLEEEGVIRSND